MKTLFLGAAAAVLLSSAGVAQTTSGDRAQNPAIKDSEVAKVETSAAGSNSFTQAQARTRIAKAGYTKVSVLKQDKDGVWRGTAMRRGKKAQVGLDYKGNVTTH